MSASNSGLSQEAMLDLMAYVDGELEGEALARTEALLQSNETARDVVSAMGDLGDIVREGAFARPEVAKADTIVHGVMRRINAEPTARMRKPRSIAPASPYRFGRVAALVAGGLAMAAAAFLFLRPAPSADTNGAQANGAGVAPLTPVTPGAQGAAGNQAAVAQESPSAVVAGSGVDVEQVESPSHQVSVFYLPAVAAAAANSNASSVVVWIGDDNGGH